MLGAAAFGALAGAMLIFPGEAAEAAREGLGLWARSVVPFLGPFMACMLMLSSRVGGGLWPRVIMGWLCGSPGSVRLMQQSRPSGPAALRCAALVGTMSPMFFLGTLGAWLENARAGGVIFLCHILGALGVGLCLRGDRTIPRSAPSPLPLSSALRESAQALLTIGLCMMLGCVAARLISCALPRLSPGVGAALQCALEVTAGVRAVIALHPPLLWPLVCAGCSFGGLSLLMQNAAFWQESGVTISRLFLLRSFHALLSFLLCLAACALTGVV